MKGYCEVCEKEIEVKMCCSGRDCGCMGQPTEPPVCSDECYGRFVNMRKSSNEVVDELEGAMDRVGEKSPEEVWEDVKPKLSDKDVWRVIFIGTIGKP